MSTREVADRLEFCEMGEGQRAILATAKPVLEKCIGPALDRFYARAARTPETAKFFKDHNHMSRAKSAQVGHWQTILSGRFDEEYYESVRRIGSVHARIGLSPRWYIGGYSLIVEELIKGIERGYSPLRQLFRLGRGPGPATVAAAVVKAALLDMELSISIYFEVADNERQEAISRAGRALAGLADGNLVDALDGLPTNFAALSASYNDAIAKLRQTIHTVSRSAEGIQTGSREIAQASEDLARRTESNAASLEQASATLVQVEERVKVTAANARSTAEGADLAINAVEEGRSIAETAVQAMARVSESARGIDQVIEGVDKIAFQTRVLAMNAAVEAGRAGEAGRGFAVVADLVSSLAMRSEEEARRARGGLTATQAEIASAVDAVTRVDRALEGISSEVGKVHGLLGQMSSDNTAQSNAISEITETIGVMDRSTQQNAAMVEETSAAARNLSDEVSVLASQTNQFRTDEQAAAIRARRAA
ncbi:globin-coupled sensor protein [Sphingomonas sp. C3-2]|uniref:globin-coupled sensor protein n=1 Tax=Sphingomonas sp. C3-2 TaxID=3062169 RepID=UPI00294AA28D|nr:globin-coupled sensor protein [Sphingomonas sp. C3-2]WOK37198.1 globin-coupled sensor protein [Sphingomonas sp. C3-2]